MKTGKDLGIFGGFLAILLGFFVISAGLSLIKYGDYPPSRSAVEEASETEAEPLRAVEIYIIVAGAVCIAGGLVGLAGGCLANRAPGSAGAFMVAAGCLAAFTIIGALSSAALASGAMRAFKFAEAPPGTEPEWVDGEALPY